MCNTLPVLLPSQLLFLLTCQQSPPLCLFRHLLLTRQLPTHLALQLTVRLPAQVALRLPVLQPKVPDQGATTLPQLLLLLAMARAVCEGLSGGMRP